MTFDKDSAEWPDDRLRNVAGESGHSPYQWLHVGKWTIGKTERQEGMLWHDEVRPQPALSFIRYAGTAFGFPDGRVSPHYATSVTVMFHQSPYSYPPTGDQGQPFYYQDPTHYVEALFKPQFLEIWEANDAEPGKSQGWKRLFVRELNTRANDRHRVGADVDTRTGLFTLYLEGQKQATVRSDIIQPGPAWVTLRAAGNQVSFDDWHLSPVTP